MIGLIVTENYDEAEDCADDYSLKTYARDTVLSPSNPLQQSANRFL